ncbi:response regulator [Nanohaloarchaea archaeon]|nr:response regulator [Candidatus Nanohaloarchaea archaeon]
MTGRDEGPNLMLIDDDQDCLDLNEAMLEREGLFNIKTTTEQEEVIDEVESSWADAVVSDYDMPEIDGLELLEDVREIDDELPYMLLTGREREEFSEEDLEKVTRYYQKDGKPETYEEIAHTVANEVERYRKLQAAGKVVGNHSGPTLVINDKLNITSANEALAEVIDEEVHDIEGEDISAVND